RGCVDWLCDLAFLLCVLCDNLERCMVKDVRIDQNRSTPPVTPGNPRRVPPSAANPSENPQSAIRNPQFAEVLYRLAALATRTDDPRAALRQMLDIFVATFHADAGSIALLSPDTGRLETEVQ